MRTPTRIEKRLYHFAASCAYSDPHAFSVFWEELRQRHPEGAEILIANLVEEG